MASPRLETFCCAGRDAATELVVTFQPLLFGALSASCACVSLVLAVLQVLPKHRGHRRLGRYPLPRPASSSRVLLIISVCDILGCAGILLRSSLWIGLPGTVEQISATNRTDVLPDIFCVGSSIWIQFFYSASYWWTFCYAIDVFLVVKTSAGISTIVLYHMITWGLAVLLCVEGVAMLYYPSISTCEQGLLHAIPHYVTTYAPMLLVLVANPMLFSRTVSAVTSLLKGRQGIYTENERRLAGEIQVRFFKIMLVFFICWTPNIINEALLFYLELQSDIGDSSLRNVRNAALITWFIMGILNPMQAFLNTLAFHGWTGLDVDLRPPRRRDLGWDSVSTSAPNGGGGGQGHLMGASLVFQGHVQEKKNGNGEQHADTISVLSAGSESSTVEIHISSSLRDFDDADADAESLENSGRQ